MRIATVAPGVTAPVTPLALEIQGETLRLGAMPADGCGEGVTKRLASRPVASGPSRR